MLTPNGIKTVLYDLDGTLRLNRPSGRDFFLDHVLSLGVPLSAEDRRRTAIWEHRYWAESPEVLLDVVVYMDPDAFWTNYSQRQLEAAGVGAGQAAALAAQLHDYMKSAYRPEDVVLPETYQVLRQLREAGYTLGVVSNRERPFRDYLVEKGLDALVDFAVSGGEAGSKKPDRGIFDYALRKANSRAEETIYVGDSYFADVVGAHGAGLRPVLFDPQGVFDGFGELALAPTVIRSHPELLTLLDGRELWPGTAK